MSPASRDVWLTLSEAAERFGVHPSTLRSWADKGLLPVHRTRGGHRRFRQAELDLWDSSKQGEAAEGSEGLVHRALRLTRFQLSEGHLENESWYAKLDEKARKDYRSSGRKLMQGLSNFLASERKVAQAEARGVGYEYAILGRRHKLTSLEAVSAYLFFRKALQEAMLGAYEAAAIQSPQAWAEMSRKINGFADEVLLALIETYRSLEAEEVA
ncbi:MAG: helix-turn-helix domain-containing protein [Chloroflexi bacterium]|nr:helix-turn-helix domain-containing protein [Chloroflexota bacterium]